MEAAQRSAEYVFQGIMYYFRREKVCPRYQFTLKDPVDPALLQQALDAALEAAPYYRVRLVWEKRKAFLEPNPEPCLVYPDSVMREMPEQTNGYFFAVHCAQNVVYFDWFHFLADGRGGSSFFTLLLKLYCNLRYGTAFACEPLVSDPPYDIEDILARYPESQERNCLQCSRRTGETSMAAALSASSGAGSPAAASTQSYRSLFSHEFFCSF